MTGQWGVGGQDQCQRNSETVRANPAEENGPSSDRTKQEAVRSRVKSGSSPELCLLKEFSAEWVSVSYNKTPPD